MRGQSGLNTVCIFNWLSIVLIFNSNVPLLFNGQKFLAHKSTVKEKRRNMGSYRKTKRSLLFTAKYTSNPVACKGGDSLASFLIFEDKIPFCGATDTPVLDFWCRLLWVSKPEWAAFLMLSRGVHVTSSLRYISGATSADLLAVLASRYWWDSKPRPGSLSLTSNLNILPSLLNFLA